MRKKGYILSILSIILLLTLAGCTFPWQKKKAAVTPLGQDSTSLIATSTATSTEQTSGVVKKFKDIDELKTFLIQHPTNNRGDLKAAKEIMSDSVTNTGNFNNIQDSLSKTAADYSTTNIQVTGVDEADIIKTNGDYIYLLDYNDLYIIKAKPSESAAIITKITFKSRPQEFYLNGDNLVVFGYDNQIFNDKTYQSFKRRSSFTYLKVFDVSDPKSPKQVRDLNLEGSYVDSRVVGDYLYFITNNYQNYLENEPILPRVFENGQVLLEKCGLSAKCYSPNVFYFDIPYESYNFTSVMAINIKNNSEALAGDVYLLSDSQNLYVSAKNIYLTYTEYLNEYDIERDVTIDLIKTKLSAEDQSKIAKIEAVDNFILSSSEKKNKIYYLVQSYISKLSEGQQKTLQAEIDNLLKSTLEAKAQEMEKTTIHKIAFNNSVLNYQAMGQVSGHVLNQFSMDEYNDYFRIATTRSQSWSRLESANQESYNNVYVLDDKLKTVGVLEKLAKGERIYSARFMGDRAYLVTYKQTDPLFVIDLKTPTTPKVLGELKIPGYSTYLHPYADNILLGFGRDTETNNNGGTVNKGLKLGLFDVSNPNSPKELDSFVTGDKYSDSIALYDHKAFLISNSKNLISIPAVFRSGQYGNRVEFSGALVFNMVDNKIKLRSRIDHSDSGNYTNQDYWSGISYYDNSVKRSLYIGDMLYTFSNKFLKINNLKDGGDLALIKTIDLLPKLSKDFEVTPVSVPVASTTLEKTATSSESTSTSTSESLKEVN